ncbi:MAG TPA: VOC family protein [Terriglobales bacterium]|nr:VOC family protein [Terriglobales bacterium]
MQAQPYLNFNGRCEEAIEFYRSALGAKVDMMMRFNEAPEGSGGMIPPGAGNKIMHSSFRVGETTILAADGECTGAPTFQGFSLCLTPATPAEAERLFGALGKGGKVQMPLMKTFFSPSFGQVQDRFGVSWMIYVAPKA